VRYPTGSGWVRDSHVDEIGLGSKNDPEVWSASVFPEVLAGFDKGLPSGAMNPIL